MRTIIIRTRSSRILKIVIALLSEMSTIVPGSLRVGTGPSQTRSLQKRASQKKLLFTSEARDSSFWWSPTGVKLYMVKNYWLSLRLNRDETKPPYNCCRICLCLLLKITLEERIVVYVKLELQYISADIAQLGPQFFHGGGLHWPCFCLDVTL